MNTKIKNYVEVLFKDIPDTNKARELKEEILSTLNDHFEEHIAEGKSENQSYTESLCDLGDVDALLQDLVPGKELKDKIELYRQKKARNTAISVVLYILSIVCVVLCGTVGEYTDNEDLICGFGVAAMFVFIAAATGLLIYTHMSIPQDVAQYITKDKHSKRDIQYNGENKALRFLAAFLEVYWMLVLVIYLCVSFATGRWGITWLIWLIASALKEALYIFFGTTEEEIDAIQDSGK